MSKQKIINEGGIIGTGKGLVNQNSKELKELKRVIKEKSGELKEPELIANRLLSLRFQMETYLERENPKKIIQIGEFLEEYVEALKIKKRDIQSKNELMEIIDRDKKKYEKYKLEDLLKEVN